MNSVTKQYGGKLPEMYMADTKNVGNFQPGDKVVMTMQQALKRDMDSRYLNDVWIQGMQESGYAGASMMAEFVDNIFGWSVASDGQFVSDAMWTQIMDTYVTSGVMDGDRFVYSYQSITGRMLEAIRTGQWEATAEQQKILTEAYIQSVLDAGVACCHHTCGNPSLDKFIAGQMSVLGLTPEEEEKYWQIVQDATDREKPEITSPPSDPSSSSSNRGSGYGTAVAVNAGSTSSESEQGEQNEQSNENQDAGQSAGVGMNTGVEPGTPITGFEMSVSQLTSSVRDFFANPSFSSSSIIAIAFVVIVVGAVFYGLRRKGL
jgi:Cobalamin biosynthesis protein CobN and related Mg-chelatases